MLRIVGRYVAFILSACIVDVLRSSATVQEGCPALVTQLGEPDALDPSHFSVYLLPSEIPSLNIPTALFSTLDLVRNGEVVDVFASVSSVTELTNTYPNLILPESLTPLPLHLELGSSAPHKIYYLFNVWSLDTEIAHPGCPTKRGELSPGDNKVNGLSLSCKSRGQVAMQACITLGTEPFDRVNGTYTTLELYFLRACETATDPICRVTGRNDLVPGEVCISVNQIRSLVMSQVGNWQYILIAFERNQTEEGFCIIDDRLSETNGVVDILLTSVVATTFYIPEMFEELDMYLSLFGKNMTDFLAFSMDYNTNNNDILAKPSTDISQGIITSREAFSLNLRCVQPGFTSVLAQANLSTIMQDTLYTRHITLSFFRNCTPADTNSTQTPSVDSRDSLMKTTLTISVTLTLLILLTFVAAMILTVFLVRRLKHKKINMLELAAEGLEGNEAYHNMKNIEDPFEFLKPYNMEYNYPSLEVVGELGEGAFGRVFKARAPGLKCNDLTAEFVAVKTLKEDTLLEVFCKEVKTLLQFNHPHIIQLLAVCSKHSQKCMIFEYMSLGGLDDLLRKSNPDNCNRGEEEGSVFITSSDFIHCSLQVAEGLAYLANQRYVHRDIATRNCLVSHGLVVKIGDFGLSRQINNMDYYRVGGTHGYMPVRWMPPEALLFGKFTTQSDVWSFGILVWEIYTFGHQPYYGLSNHEVIDAVKTGKTLVCPEQCPVSMYDIMKRCWTRSPSKRPTMETILGRLMVLTTGHKAAGSAAEISYVNLEYGAEVEGADTVVALPVEHTSNNLSETDDQYGVEVRQEGEEKEVVSTEEHRDCDIGDTEHGPEVKKEEEENKMEENTSSTTELRDHERPIDSLQCGAVVEKEESEEEKSPFPTCANPEQNNRSDANLNQDLRVEEEIGKELKATLELSDHDRGYVDLTYTTEAEEQAEEEVAIDAPCTALNSHDKSDASLEHDMKTENETEKKEVEIARKLKNQVENRTRKAVATTPCMELSNDDRCK